MPKDFIRIGPTTATAKFAQDLATFVHTYRSCVEIGTRLLGIMDHNVDHPDYVDIEALFALPTGNGDEVYNLVSGSVAALKGTAQSTDGLTLVDRVG